MQEIHKLDETLDVIIDQFSDNRKILGLAIEIQKCYVQDAVDNDDDEYHYEGQ